MAAEKNFENKVKAFLKDTGAWLLKYWGGAAYTKSGIPDLLVCSDGCFLICHHITVLRYRLHTYSYIPQ